VSYCDTLEIGIDTLTEVLIRFEINPTLKGAVARRDIGPARHWFRWIGIQPDRNYHEGVFHFVSAAYPENNIYINRWKYTEIFYK
jgi:hypothetical protein